MKKKKFCKNYTENGTIDQEMSFCQNSDQMRPPIYARMSSLCMCLCECWLSRRLAASLLLQTDYQQPTGNIKMADILCVDLCSY
jgi:hypothetical protein